jgi:hypothetical protein
MRALKVAFASAILGLVQMNIAAAQDKLTVGVALPRAQLGQPNGASADVAEPVRQVLMSYLKGPVIEVISLEARIPMQIAAEAKEKNCAFVLYTDVSQTASKGSGLKMLKKLAPMAGMLPMLGGVGGGIETQMAMSAVSQGVMQASMADAQEQAMESAMSAINGAQKSNVKAGDSLALQYRLVRIGEEQPLKAETITGKAKANGEDVLSPLLESVAVAVVGSVAGK